MSHGYVIFTNQAEFDGYEATECARRGYPLVGEVNGVPAPQNQQTTSAAIAYPNLTPGDDRVCAYLDHEWPESVTSGWTYYTTQDMIDQNFFSPPPVA